MTAKKLLTVEVAANRRFFLSELRSGKYPKGTIRSDCRGRPIVESPSDHGWCACALMHDLFADQSGGYLRALGLSAKQCRYIQQDLNDTPLTFAEIADRIEGEIFQGAANKSELAEFSARRRESGMSA